MTTSRTEKRYGDHLKTGVENHIFWSEIGSGFGEPGGTPPTKNSQEYPPRGLQGTTLNTI